MRNLCQLVHVKEEQIVDLQNKLNTHSISVNESIHNNLIAIVNSQPSVGLVENFLLFLKVAA